MTGLPCKETKKSRVFKALLAGLSFNRFEAEYALHDHCLHSTVSEIERCYRITISRKSEQVKGYQGSPTRLTRYWIDPDEIARYQATQKAVTDGNENPTHR